MAEERQFKSQFCGEFGVSRRQTIRGGNNSKEDKNCVQQLSDFSRQEATEDTWLLLLLLSLLMRMRVANHLERQEKKTTKK